MSCARLSASTPTLARLSNRQPVLRCVSRRHAAQVGPVTVEDVQAALRVSKPSARLLEERYRKFNEEYGQLAQ